MPSQGSVGASGDLAPLAHFAAVLMGEGNVTYHGVEQSAETAMRECKIKPIVLVAKEGLALINGTQFSTAAALMALSTTWKLANNAIITSSLSTDAIMGSTAPTALRDT